ncbi:MAG: outer membrane lipoprotein-sorting protein [Pseudomonadota bacterium]
MRFSTFFLAGVAAFGLALPAAAETAAQKGFRIANQSANNETGWRDLAVKGEMILYSANGNSSTRRFESRTVENANNSGSRSLLIFDWPGDIRNTALLTHSFDTAKDDQWLYLPAVRKVRRISSSGRSGAFVGSEFAYEDMLDQNVNEFSHEWIRQAPCPNAPGTCDVINRDPKGSSSYSIQTVWVDQQQRLTRMIQYFDRRGSHLKTLSVSQYRRFNGAYWRPMSMDMVNHLTGKRTRLNWSNYRFNVGVNPTNFTPNALRNIR